MQKQEGQSFHYQKWLEIQDMNLYQYGFNHTRAKVQQTQFHNICIEYFMRCTFLCFVFFHCICLLFSTTELCLQQGWPVQRFSTQCHPHYSIQSITNTRPLLDHHYYNYYFCGTLSNISTDNGRTEREDRARILETDFAIMFDHFHCQNIHSHSQNSCFKEFTNFW